MEITKYINWQQFTKGTRGKQMNSSFPDRWYLDTIRGRVESENITVSRGLNRGETKFVRMEHLLYRQFTKGN